MAGLGFSPLLFARAFEGMKRRSTRPVVLSLLVLVYLGRVVLTGSQYFDAPEPYFELLESFLSA